jgi:hypothetical protein
VVYPPKTLAQAEALAATADPSDIDLVKSRDNDDVACFNFGRFVIIPQSVTGQALAADLLHYYFHLEQTYPNTTGCGGLSIDAYNNESQLSPNSPLASEATAGNVQLFIFSASKYAVDVGLGPATNYSQQFSFTYDNNTMMGLGPTPSTTTTLLATMSTTGASQIGNGPLVDSCDMEGAPQFEPTVIVMACATGDVKVDDIGWLDWNEAVGGGPRQADGNAVFNWDNCIPNCAMGQEFQSQVTVTLSNPVIYHGATVWGTLEVDSSAGDLPGYLSTPSENGNVSQLLFPLPDFGVP